MRNRLLAAFTCALVLGAPASWASRCDSVVPKEPEFDFARMTLRMDLPESQKLRMIESACREFNLNIHELLNIGRDGIKKAGGLEAWAMQNVLPMVGQINAVWSNLGDSEVEKEYKSKLAEIAKIANPDERVRRAYIQARQYQGKWVLHNKQGSGILGTLRPGEVLRNSRDTGSGGVCREFSVLLVWTLNQVKKSPVGIPRDQFQAEFTAYPGHAIVTVKTFDNPNSRLAKVYSLDPTNYEEFTPIPYPDLNAPRAKFESRLNSCTAIKQCLQSGEAVPEDRPGSTVR